MTTMPQPLPPDATRRVVNRLLAAVDRSLAAQAALEKARDALYALAESADTAAREGEAK